MIQINIFFRLQVFQVHTLALDKLINGTLTYFILREGYKVRKIKKMTKILHLGFLITKLVLRRGLRTPPDPPHKEKNFSLHFWTNWTILHTFKKIWKIDLAQTPPAPLIWNFPDFFFFLLCTPPLLFCRWILHRRLSFHH